MKIEDKLLHFGIGNAKLYDHTATFYLPAGHSCPGAKSCLAKFDRKIRKIVDGPEQQHRCFFASMEASRANVARHAMRNFELLREARTETEMARLIHASLPARRIKFVRVHVGGDYFSATYMRAWLRVAEKNPEQMFYSYTTSLNFVVANLDKIPENMTFVASRGGKFDDLIEKFDLRESIVVYHPEQAERMGLEIDHDDSLASDPSVKKFALLLHGTQPSGSKAREAIQRMKGEGVKFSYSSK